MGLKDNLGHAIPLINALSFHADNARDNMIRAPITRVTHTNDTLRRCFELCVELSALSNDDISFKRMLQRALTASVEDGIPVTFEFNDGDNLYIEGSFSIHELKKRLLVIAAEKPVMDGEPNGEQDSSDA